jgi:hypothetical protein
MAFPCNQFFREESGTEEQIKRFVGERFGVGFWMFKKVEVNGVNASPLYRYLRFNSELFDRETGLTRVVPWNFANLLLIGMGRSLSLRRQGSSRRNWSISLRKSLFIEQNYNLKHFNTGDMKLLAQTLPRAASNQLPNPVVICLKPITSAHIYHHQCIQQHFFSFCCSLLVRLVLAIDTLDVCFLAS